jgi:hypothetical protein
MSKELPVPFLDSKALETDPDGMAFLRSVIGGDREQDKQKRSRLPGETPPMQTIPSGQAGRTMPPIREPAPPGAFGQLS